LDTYLKEKMQKRQTGTYRISSTAGESVKAFVPYPLPPNPRLEIRENLRFAMDSALISLGRLDSAAEFLPDIELLLYIYIRKEAVLSSQIEGTQSSLSDLLLFELDEMPGVPLDDVREVSNYVAALMHGIERIRGGFPLSNRLIREIHEILLRSGRGSENQPGEFRRSQNWIGGTRPGNAKYVPPPPEEVENCMSELEQFLNNKGFFGPLEKAALAHVQFETIHPFCDGNGRVGRLLVSLIFYIEKVLRLPLLYLSLYFKKNRNEYYERLNAVRLEGEWEEWMLFFAHAVGEASESASLTARKLYAQADADRLQIKKLGRIAGSCLSVFHEIVRKPITGSMQLAEATMLWPNTVNKCLKALQAEKVIEEVTGKDRNRIYIYKKYLDIVSME
jgi:Fic family protein